MTPLTSEELRRSFMSCSKTRAKGLAPPAGLSTTDGDVQDHPGRRGFLSRVRAR